MNIGKTITRLREQRGLSIRDLNIKSDIAENSLSAIEHGKKGVGLMTLIKLADALNCSLDYLCGRTTDPHPFHDFTDSKDERNADKAQFLAIMSDLYDKYFKRPMPSTLPRHSSANDGDVEKQAALSSLKSTIESGGEWKESLWTCVRLWQGEEFRTAGRGKTHSGSTAFTYTLKVSSRNGLETGELVISGRNGKTVTRSSVELAFTNALKEMSECGYVKGPKKLGQIFGGSYLYAMFIAWGVITDEADGETDGTDKTDSI